MSEIIYDGVLTGETIVKIFGTEISYDVLIEYAQSKGTHVEVYRRANAEKNKQWIEVSFDDKLVLDEYYGLCLCLHMFNVLTEIEIELEESADRCNDCGKSYDYCTCACACVDCGKIHAYDADDCEE